MVAEKPSLAASLAKLLSDGKSSQKKGKHIYCAMNLKVKSISFAASQVVHEWVGKFRGETVLFKMTSVCGHVMSLDFVGKYNSWVSDRQTFRKPIRLTVPSFLGPR